MTDAEGRDYDAYERRIFKPHVKDARKLEQHASLILRCGWDDPNAGIGSGQRQQTAHAKPNQGMHQMYPLYIGDHLRQLPMILARMAIPG